MSLWDAIFGHGSLGAMMAAQRAQQARRYAQAAFYSSVGHQGMNNALSQLHGVRNVPNDTAPLTEAEAFQNRGKLSPEWHKAAFKEYERQHINRTYGDMFPAQRGVA